MKKTISLSLIFAGLSIAIISKTKLFENIIFNIARGLSPNGTLEEKAVLALGQFENYVLCSGIIILILGITLALFITKLAKDISFGEFGDIISQPYGKNKIGNRRFNLFLVSLSVLFFELLVIRWLSTEMRVFAYFKNLPLIASFLGLGVGCALAGRNKNLNAIFLPLLFVFCFLVIMTGPKLIRYYPGHAAEFIWSLRTEASVLKNFIFYAGLTFFFILTTLLFVPLGQLMGRSMLAFKPITAYSLNILGNLAGIAVFSLISILSLSPIIWFSIGSIFCLYFLFKNRTYFFIGLITTILLIAGINLMSRKKENNTNTFWSPYYRIDVAPIFVAEDRVADDSQQLFGYNLSVNYDYHQTGVNLSDDFISKFPGVLNRVSFNHYILPFKLVNADDVLIIGSGMGNDVAAALRNGVKRIDAVEIDPVILNLGKTLHPERPYSYPTVNIINDDARAFLQKCRKKYDLVVFSSLDSHTLLSTVSNIRLDSYVYTIESFQRAKSVLKKNGFFVLTFCSELDHWISRRLYKMIREVFHKEPLSLAGATFIVSPNLDKDNFIKKDSVQTVIKKLSPLPVAYDNDLAVPTDDWPFLYIKEKKVPSVYWKMLIIILIISLAMVKPAFSQAKLDLHFFFLGSAFLLIETKSLTELSLLFGSTWIVNSIVFSGILIMILSANFIYLKTKMSARTLIYVFLFCSLFLNYTVDFKSLLGQSVILRSATSCLFTALPIFFAALIFAISFERSKDINVAFGSNLLGAVVGALFEYASLAYGIKSLYIFAAVMYILSFLFASRYLRSEPRVI